MATSTVKLLSMSFGAQLIALLSALGLRFISDASATELKSLLFGASLFMLPNGYFCLVFWAGGYRSPEDAVRRHFRAQAHKWILTILGFGMVFRFSMPLNVPSLFAAYGFLMFIHTLITYFGVKKKELNLGR